MAVFQGEANFIKRLLTDQCARPWFVYAETFLPAFLELMIMVTLLDLNDLIRARGQKISAGGGARAGRGGRHTPLMRGQNVISSTERYMQKGLRTLLIVTQPLENIGYAWLMYSAVDQFFYDWQTLIDQSPYCEKNDAWGPLHRSRGGGFVTINTSGFPIIMTNLDQNRSSWPTTTISATVPPATMSFLFAATIGSPPGGITGVTIRLKMTDGFVTTYIESEPQDIAADEQKDFILSDHFFGLSLGGVDVQWELRGPAVPAGIWCEKARVIFFRSS